MTGMQRFALVLREQSRHLHDILDLPTVEVFRRKLLDISVTDICTAHEIVPDVLSRLCVKSLE